MNNCSKYIEQMNMYLDGELKGSKISELLEHIERCPNCKKRFEAMKIISFQSREMDVAIPIDLHEKIMRNVRSNSRPVKVKGRFSKTMSLVVAAAVFLIVISGAFSGFTPGFISWGSKSEETATFSPAANVKTASVYEGAGKAAPAGASDEQKTAILETAKESPMVNGGLSAEQDEFAFLKLFSGSGEMPEFISEYNFIQDSDSLLYYVYVENSPEAFGEFEEKMKLAGFVDGGEMKNASNINEDALYVLYIVNIK